MTSMTTDVLERLLIELESAVSRIRAGQIQLLREADRRQTPLADGCRSLQEWTAGRLDIAPETAKTLVSAARTLADQPDLEDRLETGTVSFDRILATATLAATCATEARVEQSAGFDIPGVRRLTALHRHMTRSDQQQVFSDRFQSMQPTLDRTGYRFWGKLPGVDGELVEQALLTRADSLPLLPDGGKGTFGQRHADALVSISQDSLTSTSGSDSSAGPILSVFTTTQQPISSDGDAGATTASGLCVGSQTLEEIFCSGSVEHITFRNGQPLAAGRTTRVIPPRLRRAILYRDGGCVARQRDGTTLR
ncbi:MAG: DUF222 domain-containing protein [Acidimicrobiia bacterium]|nr:DUF222 domain-containing protein [Acidimicrobiia bacterium]